MATTTEIEEARDWQGELLDCAACEHGSGKSNARCQLGHACVHDRYARRIDRFFRWNPYLAKDYFEHPYFETRAVAAKHAELFYLPRLIDDPDETVRQSVAQRLPLHSRHFRGLLGDPHREVRVRVAERAEPKDLVTLMDDPDYFVRQIVARRLPSALLVRMVRDRDPQVRKVVAERVATEWLPTMAGDADLAVRLAAVSRMSPGQLKLMIRDPDWRVRYEVASRLDPTELEPLRADPDREVRELVEQRLADYWHRTELPKACQQG
ncbi:4Fe4S-binding leucine-rich repeat protein [Methylolobus aquaticus]